ncbi:MAG: type II toxin-antitoxin system PemK/MazF family toxin [Acidobacteriota bacterium]|jgi:mRNA interferase MazF|nr:type II toxin-antitoxin system PemK/MazF family toxin [Acidobacteriota bacterium]
MKRGEIWTLQDDRYASKARPVIIIQGTLADAFDSVILCLLTTFDSEKVATRVKVEPNEFNGLLKTSFVMTEKLITVRKEELGILVGNLTDSQMHAIARQLASVLEITADDI